LPLVVKPLSVGPTVNHMSSLSSCSTAIRVAAGGKHVTM
jgi:hypothetical protein